MKTFLRGFLTGIGIGLCILIVMAAVPALTDFNSGQFNTTGNKVSIADGATITNAALKGAITTVENALDAGGHVFSGAAVGGTQGRFTNLLFLPFTTASTLLSVDATKNVASIANGTGALTNDGAGGFGWATLSSGTIGGSGTANRVARFTAATTLGNSGFSDDGSSTISIPNSYNQLLAPDGAAANPGVGFTTESTVGLARIASASLSLVAGAGERLRIDATKSYFFGSIQGAGLSKTNIVATDGSTNLAMVTIGTGLSFDGSTRTLSASALGTSGSAYSIVGGSATATVNWTSLSNAYVTAKASTPHGNALAAGNRYTIFLLPGIYDMGASSLTLDTQFIDIVGISPNTGVRQSALTTVDFGDTVLTSSTKPINVTAGSQDILVANLCCKTTTSSSDSTIETSQTGFKADWKCINVLLIYAGSGNRQMQWDKGFSGYWEDVRCVNATGSTGSRAFGVSVSSSITMDGTFIRCKANEGFAIENNVGITMSGTFIDCEAGASGFGGAGPVGTVLSGKFLRCRYNGVSSGAMFGGTVGTLSGSFDSCISAAGAAWGLTFSGIMNNCSGVEPTSWTTVTGTVTGCNFPRWRNGATITVDTTQTGNVGGGEDNLITYSVQAGRLGINGDTLHFDCAGTFNNSTHNKQLKVYFGTNVVFDTGSLSGATLGASSWRAHGKIIRTGATTQKSTTEFTLSGALLGALTTTTTTYSTLTTTLSGAITFKCTGTDLDGTPSNNEVVQEIEHLSWTPSS